MTDSEKLDLLISGMQGMKGDMRGTKEDMQGMKEELRGMKEDMQGMKGSIQELNQKVTKIELTIENEICDNIQRIAEGHLDLSRNLHDAMKPSNEVEILAVKVNKLEMDVKKLKAKIS